MLFQKKKTVGLWKDYYIYVCISGSELEQVPLMLSALQIFRTPAGTRINSLFNLEFALAIFRVGVEFIAAILMLFC